MKANVLLITCLFTLLTSCQERKEQETIPTQSLKHELLMGDEYFIKRIANMTLMNDSIIVLRSSKSEKLFQILNPSQKTVFEFGDIGQGPNDFLLPSSLSSEKDNSFSFYDLNKRRYSTIHLNHENDSWQVEHHFKSDSLIHISVMPVADNRYIATGMYPKHRLTLLDENGNLQKGFFEIPYRDEKERKVNKMVRAEAYQGKIAVSPSRKKLVQAMSKGDMIYFYNITGNGELILLSEQVNSYPKYRYDNGAMHQESPIHYLDISVTEDYVYALYSGRNYKDDKDKAFQGNLLRVFDWNGKLVKEFHLDIDVQAITTTKNNQRIYAVSYLPDPVLVAFEQ